MGRRCGQVKTRVILPVRGMPACNRLVTLVTAEPLLRAVLLTGLAGGKEVKSLKRVRSAKRQATPKTTQPGSDTGAAAVEFALVLPVLLLVIFGIITWGFIFAAQISLNGSARDAARAGVVKSLGSTGAAKTCSEIVTLARDGAVTIGVDTTKIDITVTGPAGTCSTTSPSYNGEMCSATNGQLVVVLRYTAVSPVPLVPPRSVGLKATGAFQCEF